MLRVFIIFKQWRKRPSQHFFQFSGVTGTGTETGLNTNKNRFNNDNENDNKNNTTTITTNNNNDNNIKDLQQKQRITVESRFQPSLQWILKLIRDSRIWEFEILRVK